MSQLLSILIPTYNYDARALVGAFLALATREGVEAEILIGDDASTQETHWLNEVEAWPQVRVLRSSHNSGRARNCNRLAEAASGRWLLFVDSDARIEDDFSLRRYLSAAEEAPVVCGGLRHPETNPCPRATLRYRYERQADKRRSAACRNRAPYSQLSTFNILVRRDVFLQIRFDEDCTEYGYEDTLFGAELQAHGVKLLHIDNPLVHIGLEPNDVYLDKVETSLRTLKRLNGKLGRHSRIETAAAAVRRWHLLWFFKSCHQLFGPLMRRNLLGRHPHLTLFQWYKLGFYLNL